MGRIAYHQLRMIQYEVQSLLKVVQQRVFASVQYGCYIASGTSDSQIRKILERRHSS